MNSPHINACMQWLLCWTPLARGIPALNFIACRPYYISLMKAPSAFYSGHIDGRVQIRENPGDRAWRLQVWLFPIPHFAAVRTFVNSSSAGHVALTGQYKHTLWPAVFCDRGDSLHRLSILRISVHVVHTPLSCNAPVSGILLLDNTGKAARHWQCAHPLYMPESNAARQHQRSKPGVSPLVGRLAWEESSKAQSYLQC